MENTRRSFLKKVSVAGLGAAGLAMAGNAGATSTITTSTAAKAKKPAGKDDGKLRFGFIGTGSRCHEHINNVLARKYIREGSVSLRRCLTMRSLIA